MIIFTSKTEIVLCLILFSGVQVSSKLRVAYETDLQAMTPQSMMFPGLHPAAMMSTVGLGNQQQYRGSGFSGASGPHGVSSRPSNPPQIPNETCYLYIPNAAVGAVIGINNVFYNKFKTYTVYRIC